ncbi:MAG: hypothetical protein DME04_23830 [Candidatus Rokuibacteriota bacterium]|nr:MAG: hypothetical protein DME04_23830 [Candidatus Rokubacteria bacterium]
MRQTLKTPIVLPAALVLAEDFAGALGAFLGEHRRCGELDGSVADTTAGTQVWMSCSGCGAVLHRRFSIDDGQKSEE